MSGNAGERRKTRRFREFLRLGRSAAVDKVRADRSAEDVAKLQEALAEQEAQHATETAELRDTLARVVAERGELDAEVRRLRVQEDPRVQILREELGEVLEHLDDALTMTRTMRERNEILASALTRLESQHEKLAAEDRDAAKLRRRLREAHDELASCHERIRRLEAGQRAAVAAEPVRLALR